LVTELTRAEAVKNDVSVQKDSQVPREPTLTSL